VKPDLIVGSSVGAMAGAIGYYAGHNEEYRRRVIALAEAYTRKHVPEIRAAVERAAQVASTARTPSGVTSR
jgi:predicted acylesterase/phospholipase RssA